MGSLLNLDECHFNEDFIYAFRTEHPPRFARAYPLTQREAAELGGLLGGVCNFNGFRLAAHSFIAIFVELKIDRFSHPIENQVRETLADFAKGDCSVLYRNDPAAVFGRSLLERQYPPGASAFRAPYEWKRLRGFAAAFAKKSPERGRPRDMDLQFLLRSLYELAGIANAPRRLGSHQTDDCHTQPLVKFAERVLLLASERGLAVLANRPELDEAIALKAHDYFMHLPEMGWRAIADAIRKVRGAQKSTET